MITSQCVTARHVPLQSYRNIGSDFVRHAGYNEWADTNHIIVLYPQTRDLDVINPQACWDWWGYLDADPTQSPAYLLKSGHRFARSRQCSTGLPVLPSLRPDPLSPNFSHPPP